MKGRVTGERERSRSPTAGSLPKCQQQPGLGHAEARSLEFHPRSPSGGQGPKHWSRPLQPRRCTSRELDWKRRQDLIPDRGCGSPSGSFTPLAPHSGASPLPSVFLFHQAARKLRASGAAPSCRALTLPVLALVLPACQRAGRAGLSCKPQEEGSWGTAYLPGVFISFPTSSSLCPGQRTTRMDDNGLSGFCLGVANRGQHREDGGV